MKCPRCLTETFKMELYEGIEIDRCAVCQGTWLDSGEMSEIISRREVIFSSEEVNQTLRESTSGVPESEQASELLCPKCTTAMQSVNYAYQSGVIVDVCNNGHGAWLDVGELEKIQMFSEEVEGMSKANAVKCLTAAARNLEDPLHDFVEVYKQSSIAHKLIRFVSDVVNSICRVLSKRRGNL